MFWRSMLLMISGVLAASACRSATADAFTCRTRDQNPEAVVSVETNLAGVPAILRVPKNVTKAPIVLWHGFGPPASEGALMKALPLDDVPAIKVYLGLPLFGRRAEAGGVEALKHRQETDVASLIFEPVVVGAAKELPAALKALQAIDCMKPGEKVGLFGFSAGGAAALFALAERDVPIGSAVVLNSSTGLSTSIAAYEQATGNTYAWTDAARELARRTDAAGRAREIASGHPPPALLILQGAADATLTAEPPKLLHAKLAPFYQGQDAHRELLLLAPGFSHNVTDATSIGNLRTWVGEWFDRYLDAKR
jgi:predicted esterase